MYIERQTVNQISARTTRRVEDLSMSFYFCFVRGSRKFINFIVFFEKWDQKLSFHVVWKSIFTQNESSRCKKTSEWSTYNGSRYIICETHHFYMLGHKTTRALIRINIPLHLYYSSRMKKLQCKSSGKPSTRLSARETCIVEDSSKFDFLQIC